MTQTTDSPRITTNRQMEARDRCKLLRCFVGRPVEMLAGEDDLVADRGTFVGVRAGDAWTEPAVIVNFERNGRWAIPVSMLFIPGTDTVIRETAAFILAGPFVKERRYFGISLRLLCETSAQADPTQNPNKEPESIASGRREA